MKKTRKSKKGFTLIELIVVVAILAILAAIAVPNFIGMTERARKATVYAAAAEIANGINIYNTLHEANTDKIDANTEDILAKLDAEELRPVIETTEVETAALGKILFKDTYVAYVNKS